jgi:hypothetical protein
MTTLQEQARAAARNHIWPGDPLPVLLRAIAAALALLTAAASAAYVTSDCQGRPFSGKCTLVIWPDWCPEPPPPSRVKVPQPKRPASAPAPTSCKAPGK